MKCLKCGKEIEKGAPFEQDWWSPDVTHNGYYCGGVRYRSHTPNLLPEYYKQLTK